MAALAFTHPDAKAQNAMSREHLPAKKTVTEARLMQQLSFLCDSLCNGRGFLTRGGAEAGFWIQREFERIGLMRMGESYGKKVYSGQGKTGHNIVAMLPGSKHFTRDRYVIVGAHYDHIGNLSDKMYPGADANASGTVALINLAEMLKALRDYGKSHNHNVIFVAFDGKEQSMAGSYAFWRMIENGELIDPQTGKIVTKEKISLMVNIDQIGSTLSPLKSGRKDYIIMLGTESLKPIKRDMLAACNRMYAIDMDIDLTYYGSRDFTKMFYRLSDQRVFVDNGIPAVLFTSGITMNTNKTWDTPQTLDMNIFKKRIFLMYHWIEKMIQ
jgi:Zn-dependent M28 family amino/carboxypeptidase